MDSIFQFIPPDFVKFLMVGIFSLLIGLEQRRHHINEPFESLFGTDRTFTLIGILGFILYIISPKNLFPFLTGGAALAGLMGIYYYQKIVQTKQFGVTTLLIGLITYCLTPIVYTQPPWLILSIVVLILVITELKETLFNFSKKVDNDEFFTLGKFLILAGIILPLLPDKSISETINFSPFKFWLAIVAVSGISYISYLMKKFIFPQSGIILSGILGGLYSSTATTIILAKKSKEMPEEGNKVAAAILLATTMMYLRIFLLALVFNQEMALKMAPYFAVFVAVSSLIAWYFSILKQTATTTGNLGQTIAPSNNPLELKTSILFGTLFIVFAVVTSFVKTYFGTGGINILSFVVGVTDIDPFILNLFQGKWDIAISVILVAVLNAITSNNILKMIYGISFCVKSIRIKLILGLGILIALGLGMALFIHFGG